MNDPAPAQPTLYDVFAPRGTGGGKRVAVFGDAAGDLQRRAAAAGAPLSVFVEDCSLEGAALRVFTPEREKGESDSASVAALTYLQGQGVLSDVLDVLGGPQPVPAQLCGGEWLLSQGVVEVTAAALPAGNPSGLPAPGALHLASAGRPNLCVEVASLAELDAWAPAPEAVEALGHATGTTGLIVYALEAPAEGPQRRADVSFRAFGPLRGFAEDAASSNMFACLVAVLGAGGRLPPGASVVRGAQRRPGQPALLTAQFSQAGEPVWVGGPAVGVPTETGGA
ncbi:PhzF family phenazine biosynthesis protein [Deinococcus sp. Leaf326]|uniref:PhzF family phenazine biosynthesis protein n=1 Tax=Deinococcus sp. Leaf326 TaxID=1736338 RepID=UPI000700640B|nr:PhzF family phenazine biosynthesis protein [Deinococcus sp. Leaf326]KQR40700.1 phenazine biosynthesis PhzC/PhzF protein [Deinococcus sp. Leaf326]